MYEKATVLEYENKKIWIKNIVGNVYCVNGRYIGFHDTQDLTDVVVLANALDSFYSPLTKPFTETTALSYNRDDRLESGKYRINVSDIRNCIFDVSNAPAILKEYKSWAESVDSESIYINDHRNDSVESWLFGT